jgi:hypothetical protein
MFSPAFSGGKQASALALVVSLVVTLLIAVGCGSSQDVATEIERPVPERTAFLVGQVFFPDGEPAEEATVQTEPFTTTVYADTQGVFHIYEEMVSGEYQFNARHARYPDERGQTAVSIGQVAPSDSVYIVMGRSMTHQPIDVDSLGGSGGSDEVRPGN